MSVILNSLPTPISIANGGTNNSTTYTAGSVIFSDGTKLTEKNANFFWDNTNNRLGLGTTSPAEQFQLTANLRMPVTTGASAGVIFAAADRFIHNYGTDNIFVGITAGNFTMSGNGGNLGFGTQALSANTTGFYNVAVGPFALRDNTIGQANTAVGRSALQSNTTGQSNVALGRSALILNTSGDNNFALGTSVLQSNTIGAANIGIGINSLSNNTTGNDNVAIGFQALFYNQTGLNNVAIGRNIGVSTPNASLSENTIIGFQAGNQLSTGSSNVLIGFQAGSNLTTGGTNIVIGYNISSPTATNSNTMTIGNLIFATGLTSTGTTISTGNVGIATSSPQATLDDQGGFRVKTNAVSINTTLDSTYNTVFVTTGAGGVAITLPTTTGNTVGLIFYIFKIDSGVGLLTISPSGTDLLNGVNAGKTIANQWNGVRVQGYNSTGWVATSFTGL